MPLVLANIFQPLIDVFDSILQFFHNSFGFGWGFSIIALTIVVRLVLIPLTLKQFKSMQALQRLAPEMKLLQEKYKDDKQRLNEEMMKFYRENKVNPFGSCLPLVLQMPVFISLFYMLRHDLRMDICGQVAKPCGDIAASHGAEKFLFIPDITAAATGWVLAVLLALYIGSQLASSVLMSVNADKNQRMLMIALPFVFTFFIINFPAGLIVYWITTNLWTVGQQYFVRKTIGPIQPAPVPAGAAAASSIPGAAAGSGGGGLGRLLRGVGAGAGPTRAPSGDAAGAEPEKGATKTTAPERRQSAPPRPPRKKKKRSGRRR
jgi:YidC/Oxa1 family membrane protein insertase